VATASANTGQVFVIDPTTGARALIRTVTPNVTGVTVRENRVIVAASNNTVTSIRAGKGASPFTAASWSIEGTLGGAAGYAEGVSAQFSSPYLLSSGRDGILLADTSNHRIRRIILPNFIGGFSSQPVRFSNAQRINASGNAAYSIGGLDPGEQSSVDVAFTVQFGAAMTFEVTVYGDVAGAIPVEGGSSGGVNVFVRDIAGRRGVNRSIDGIGDAAGIREGYGMSVTDNDWVFFTEDGLGRVRVMSPSGKVTTIIGLRPQTGPQTNGNGDTFVAGTNSYQTISVNRTGTVLVFTANHAVYRATRSGAIDSPSSWTVSLIAGLPTTPGNVVGTGDVARFEFANATVSESGDTIYVSDYINSNIKIIQYNGNGATNPVNWIVSNLAGSPTGISGNVDGAGSAARFDNPWQPLLLANGDVVIADLDNATLRRVTPSGIVSTIATGTGFAFSVAADDAGGLYYAQASSGIFRVANGGNQLILPITGSTNDGLAQGSGMGVNSFARIAANRATGRLFFSSDGRNTIAALDQIVP
jgi:hypothetical protein